MELTYKQKGLLTFVQRAHGEQVRKYTGEPYWTHPLAVAEILTEYCSPEALGLIEIALCHDTPLEAADITQALNEIGYEPLLVEYIVQGVEALTDVYTHKAYPYLNRKARKILETKRLAGIRGGYQTVKYADLLHNTGSIVAHDASFAKEYLREKAQMLRVMDQGNRQLYIECLHKLVDCWMELP
jgi:(p)ppGpp synthase/HD superfamily hydrolase